MTDDSKGAPATPSNAGSPNAAGEVIQADRDEAGLYVLGLNGSITNQEYARNIRDGYHDASPAVQDAYRHRLADTNEAASQPVEREAERLDEQEALDAVADSIGASAVYGPTEGWVEGKTLTVLFKNSGQLAKFRYVGLRDAPTAADLRGEPA